MAPKLACVCSSWNAAVAATPELWHILDTAAVPKKSWPSGRQGASPAKHGRKKAAAAKQLTAEQGLSLWVASGRLQELQSLLLYGDGTAAANAADGSAAGHNRQLSAQLLEHIAGGCQQLRRLSIFGVLSLRPEVISIAGVVHALAVDRFRLSASVNMPLVSMEWFGHSHHEAASPCLY
jgi:hypothetical protein